MAIEKVITIKSTDQKMAKNNNPYLEVVAQDDKKYSIFDQALWNLFSPNLSVKLSLEKKGNFWNVVGAESVKDALEAQQKIAEQGDDGNTTARSISISYAKDMACWGVIKPDAIVSWATVFYKYITGEFVRSEDKIILQFVATYGKTKDKEE